ncbi:hypothetical protein CABS03_02804 [Colletotrichum abscissum]|uniref:Uncharacterized protein n=2 Tax=Colletotrichum acutatum species complex TaxID=2707335 RepID=A0A9P9XLG2_9PEZI|nr:hypothetical protein CABS02_04487 [Colletotrichum abscissum]
MTGGAKTVGGQESIANLISSVPRLPLDCKPREATCCSLRSLPYAKVGSCS